MARRLAEKKTYFHNVNVRAIRAKRLKPAILKCQPPPPSVMRKKKKGFSSGTLKRFARIRRFSSRICESICALDGPHRQSPIASDFGSRTQIAALFAVLLHQSVSIESPIARFASQLQIAGTSAIRIARFLNR